MIQTESTAAGATRNPESTPSPPGPNQSACLAPRGPQKRSQEIFVVILPIITLVGAHRFSHVLNQYKNAI